MLGGQLAVGKYRPSPPVPVRTRLPGPRRQVTLERSGTLRSGGFPGEGRVSSPHPSVRLAVLPGEGGKSTLGRGRDVCLLCGRHRNARGSGPRASRLWTLNDKGGAESGATSCPALCSTCPRVAPLGTARSSCTPACSAAGGKCDANRCPRPNFRDTAWYLHCTKQGPTTSTRRSLTAQPVRCCQGASHLRVLQIGRGTDRETKKKKKKKRRALPVSGRCSSTPHRPAAEQVVLVPTP